MTSWRCVSNCAVRTDPFCCGEAPTVLVREGRSMCCRVLYLWRSYLDPVVLAGSAGMNPGLMSVCVPREILDHLQYRHMTFQLHRQLQQYNVVSWECCPCCSSFDRATEPYAAKNPSLHLQQGNRHSRCWAPPTHTPNREHSPSCFWLCTCDSAANSPADKVSLASNCSYYYLLFVLSRICSPASLTGISEYGSFETKMLHCHWRPKLSHVYMMLLEKCNSIAPDHSWGVAVRQLQP